MIPEGNSEVDDVVLAQGLFRFRLLWSSALTLASDTEKDQMLSYVKRLEDSFQEEQEEFFGISAHEKFGTNIFELGYFRFSIISYYRRA